MRQQINLYTLLPQEISGPFLISTKAFVASVSFFVGILTVFSCIDVLRLHQSSVRLIQLKAQLQTALADVIDVAANYPGLENSIQDDPLHQKRNQIHQLQTVLWMGKNPVDILSALSKAIVSDIWLTEIAVTDGGKSIDLVGQALQVNIIHDYMNQLAKQSIFSDLTFQITTLTDEAKTDKSLHTFDFRITAKVAS